jgi:hypothetical protein
MVFLPLEDLIKSVRELTQKKENETTYLIKHSQLLVETIMQPILSIINTCVLAILILMAMAVVGVYYYYYYYKANRTFVFPWNFRRPTSSSLPPIQHSSQPSQSGRFIAFHTIPPNDNADLRLMDNADLRKVDNPNFRTINNLEVRKPLASSSSHSYINHRQRPFAPPQFSPPPIPTAPDSYATESNESF